MTFVSDRAGSVLAKVPVVAHPAAAGANDQPRINADERKASIDMSVNIQNLNRENVPATILDPKAGKYKAAPMTHQQILDQQ